MSLFTSNKEKEDLRKDYIKHLKNLNPKKIEYKEGFLLWKTKYSVKDMIYEMEHKTVFSNKILHNIQANRIFTD